MLEVFGEECQSNRRVYDPVADWEAPSLIALGNRRYHQPRMEIELQIKTG